VIARYRAGQAGRAERGADEEEQSMRQPSSHRPRPHLAGASAAALLIALLGACSEPPYRAGRGPAARPPDGDGMPAWVNNPPLDLHVVYGVGADVRHDRERAMIDARHDIARQLHIVVEGDGRDDEDVEVDDQLSASGAHPRVLVDHLELPGLTMTRLADTPRCLYVQVALNREAWAASLRQRIAELDAQIAGALQVTGAGGAHRVATAAARYQRLLPLLSDREEKVSHLQIADPGSPLPMGQTSLAAERELLTAELDQVSVELIADPELEAVLPQIAGSCANLGLHMAGGGPAPTLRMRLQLRVSALPVEGMIRMEGDFDAATVKDGREIGNFHIHLRSSSLTETIARDRLMRKILLSWTDYLEHDFASCLTHL
jgi:hypothetical protein